MNQFFNNHNNIVPEALSGLLKSSNTDLYLLDALPHTKCVIRKDWDKSKVAILSGGGAGHEPAHAGFVGAGMLTGAISGEIFASPSVDAILAAILQVTGEKGCLLVIKNYTGDRLNFGLAAERAKNLGLNVEMLIVKDDISIPDSKQPRGIAGTLFIHKVAGYLSESELSLDEIKEHLDLLNSKIYSIGIAYSSCSLPGIKKEVRQEAELGLGIHGEPGVEKILPKSAQQSMNIVIDQLSEALSTTDTKIGVLLNNLGSTSNLEMLVLMNDLLSSSLAPRIEWVFGPQSYMTALNMHGFSISIVELNADTTTALLAPTEVNTWIPGTAIREVELVPLNQAVKQPVFVRSKNGLMEKLVNGLCDLLITQEAYLNELDSKVGDGDTGMTFANGARAVIEAHLSHGLPLDNPDELFLTIGNQLSTAMGGSSGVLLSIFFTSAGNAYQSNGSIAMSFSIALNAVMKYGGARLGDRTMLDAAIPAIAAWNKGRPLIDIVQAATDGANGTAEILKANAGRSSYLRSDSLKGIKDPGAVAIALMFQEAANLLT